MDNGAGSYRRFLDGEEEGFYEIVRDHKDGLILYVNTYVNSLCESEEIVQETFARLAIRKPRFFGRSSFKTWLYTIARNIALDELRRKRREAVPLDEVEGCISDDSDVETAYLKREMSTVLREAMLRLKPEYSGALWLVYFERFDNKDAARIMKKSSHQFENLLYRAKQSLKKQLEKGGYTYDTVL